MTTPTKGREPAFCGPNEDSYPGLSKREYFAAMALRELFFYWDTHADAGEWKVEPGSLKERAEWYAKAAVHVADALLAELAKEGGHHEDGD